MYIWRMLFRSIRDPGSSRRHKVELSWYRNLANSRLAKEKQIANHTLASSSINFTESPFICRTWPNKSTAGAVFTATTFAVARCQSDRDLRRFLRQRGVWLLTDFLWDIVFTFAHLFLPPQTVFHAEKMGKTLVHFENGDCPPDDFCPPCVCQTFSLSWTLKFFMLFLKQNLKV